MLQDTITGMSGGVALISVVTLHSVLVHLVAEPNRHAGHADILREQLDGSIGEGPDVDARGRHDKTWWAGSPGANRTGRPARWWT